MPLPAVLAMKRRIAKSSIRLDDEKSEVVRREHDSRLDALEAEPQRVVINNVALADGVVTPVSHRLGRVPKLVVPSAIRGASTSGRIEELRDGSVDRTKQVAIRAVGYGTTITIDLEVVG